MATFILPQAILLFYLRDGQSALSKPLELGISLKSKYLLSSSLIFSQASSLSFADGGIPIASSFLQTLLGLLVISDRRSSFFAKKSFSSFADLFVKFSLGLEAGFFIRLNTLSYISWPKFESQPGFLPEERQVRTPPGLMPMLRQISRALA